MQEESALGNLVAIIVIIAVLVTVGPFLLGGLVILLSTVGWIVIPLWLFYLYAKDN